MKAQTEERQRHSLKKKMQMINKRMKKSRILIETSISESLEKI